MRDTFQMCKLDLEKAERNQRSHCQHHRKSKGIAEKHLLLFTDNTKAFDCVDHDKLWTILKEMEIPDHLTCFLRNLYAGQEAIVRTRRGTMDWFKTGDGVQQSCVLSPSLLYLYLEHIMWNARLDEAQAGIKVARRNITNLRYADGTTFMAESKN